MKKILLSLSVLLLLFAGIAPQNAMAAKLPATVTINQLSLTQTYTGQPLTPTVTTTPPGLSVTWTKAPDTNAGTYNVLVTISDPSYTAATATGSFKILPASASISLNSTSMQQTYTGSGLAPTAATTPAGLSYSIAGPTTKPMINASSYAVTATITNPNYTATPATGNFTINPAPVTFAFSNLEPTYTGHALAPTVTPTATPAGVTYTVTGGTNAGSYTATATSSNPNYTGTASATFIIDPAPVTVALSKMEQTFTGSALSPTVTTTPAGVSVTLTPTLPTGVTSMTNAGSYQVTATSSNSNYTGSTDGTFLITRAAAKVALSGLTLNFTGSAQTPIATTTPPGLKVVWTNAPVTTVGEYQVEATISETNYTGSATGTFKIMPSTTLGSITLSNMSQVYTGSPLTPTVTTSPAGLAYTITGGAEGVGIDAGTYRVKATITDPNYVASTSGTFTITPHPATLTLERMSLTYTGKALSPYATTSPAGLSYSITGAGKTNVGSYPVTATITDPNYSGTTGSNFVITQATANVTLVNMEQTYTKSALLPTVMTDPPGLSNTLTLPTGVTSMTNVGSYPGVTATITNPNYTGSASGTFIIDKAIATVTLTATTMPYTPLTSGVGGTPLYPSVSTVPAGLALTWTGAPQANAGSYNVTATVNDPNYTGSATGTFIITQVPATVALSNLNLTYTGLPQTPAATTTPTGLSVALTDATQTNAGSYWVTATITDPNYTGSTTGTFTINPATATVALTPASLTQTYTGSPLQPTATTTPAGAHVILSNVPETNAGSYLVEARISDPNYIPSSTFGTFVISPAAGNVTLGNMTQTYTGLALTPTATVSPAGATVTWTGVTGDINAASYPVTATISGANFTTYTATGNFVINQATPILSVSCPGGVYNGSPYACTGTATGIGGAAVSGYFTFAPGSETNAGSYPETATFTSADPNYVSGGTASATLAITGIYNVSGQISMVNGGGMLQGATVSLGGGLTATTDVNGNFTFTSVPAGTYTLTPSYTFPAGSDPTDSSVFYPASQSLTLGSNLTGQNFTAQLGYTVSGMALYTGTADPTNVSQLYVNMQNTACSTCSPNGTSLVFEMPGPYQFTIHGVTPGAYTLQSWFDLSGYGAHNIADPMSSGNPVTVSTASGDVTNVSVTLTDPASWANLAALPGPTMTVSPAIDKGVIVYYQSLKSAGVEQATQYNLCWSSITGGGSDADCKKPHPTYGGALSMSNSDAFWEDSGSGKIVILDGGDTSSIFYTKTPSSDRPADGNLFSFCLQGVNGKGVGGNWTCQDVTLAAPPTLTTAAAGTSTLAMSVKTPVKATGAVYAGCYDPAGNALYVATDDSKPTAGTHSYTVYGIPSTVANCNVVAAMDQNSDGFLTPLDPDAGSLFGGSSGDIFNLGRNSTLTALTVGGTTTASLLDLTPFQKNSSATVTTQNNLDPNGVQSYSVNFDVRPLMRMPAGVELTSGPNVLQPIDFAPGCATCGQGEFNVSVNTFNQVPSGTYTLAVSDESTAGSPVTDKPTLTVGNVVGDFATNLSATGGNTPTFTWAYPANNTSAYTYQFTLLDASGNVISQVPVTTSTNSITPSVTLTSGAAYTWSLTTIDSNGNKAQQKATYEFTPQAATITLGNMSQTYTGGALVPSVTTVPSGLSYSLTGATSDINAGSYSVTATITDPNYTGSASGTFTINQATASVMLSNLTQAYSGSSLAPVVTTIPAGLTVILTGAPDINAGSYAVTATINDPNYVGSVGGTFVITVPTYNVSGQISLINGGGMLQGATVSLGGGLTATTDVNGDFTIPNVPAGSYTLTPSYTFPTGSDPTDSSVFYPASQSLTVSGNVTGQNLTAQLGYTVSGMALYTGLADPTNVSQLYVNMQNTACSTCSPNGTSLVFEMPGPYQFTIHGVTPGAYTLQSWFDLSGYGAHNIADPMSSGNPVTVSTANGDVTNVSVTLTDPTSWANLAALPGPTMTVSPAIDKGVIVYYQSIMSAGVEQATQYNLCWSSITGGGSDADCEKNHPTYGGALSINNSDAFWENSGTGKIVILDGGDTSSIFYTKSPSADRPVDGNQFSFCLQGVNGKEVGGPWTCQDVTLAAPPTSSAAGTSTLAMSVKTPIKATGAVYSGCYDPAGNALYVHTDESKPSAGTHSYTVYGIPSTVANCNVVAAMDENNDGFLTPLDPDAGSLFGGTSGDIFNLGRNSTLTALTVGGTPTASLLDLTPYHQNSSTTLTTQNNLDPTGVQSYSVNFDVRPLMRMPAGVELTSGLNVLQTIDFAPGCTTCGQGEFNVTVSTANQAPSGNYTLAVSDESTAASPVTDTPTLAVSAVVVDFATNLSATGGTTPTFTWSYPVNNTSAYTYQFTLLDASGNVISKAPVTTTSASITPSVTLTHGTIYTWAITTIDSNGNTAQQKATYQP